VGRRITLRVGCPVDVAEARSLCRVPHDLHAGYEGFRVVVEAMAAGCPRSTEGSDTGA
jgi:hypothetical protein